MRKPPASCRRNDGHADQGLGSDHVLWGTDSLWFGSPQWQIEAFRRMEIPEDMQRKYGYAPLGPADGPVKRAILGENGARVYGISKLQAQAAWLDDGLARRRADYLAGAPERSNLAYGYVRKATST